MSPTSHFWRNTLLAISAALVLLVFGSAIYRSQQLNVGDLLTQQKPADATFIGRWELQRVSHASVTNRTGAVVIHAELTIKAGGRFTAVEFPIEDSFSSPKWSLKSGDGYWELYRNQYWVVSLGFADGFGTPLDIRVKNGAIDSLTYSVGDPDSNELWIWRRIGD